MALVVQRTWGSGYKVLKLGLAFKEVKSVVLKLNLDFMEVERVVLFRLSILFPQ